MPIRNNVKCHERGCDKVVALSKWNKIKSQWYFSMGGYAYCPDHIPAWVIQWRASRLSESK